MLRGSSATILSLTPPETPRVGHGGMPPVYHAFAHSATKRRWPHDRRPARSHASPRVPQSSGARSTSGSAESLDVEDAMMAASQRPLLTPVVLFLRHRFGRQFTRQGDERAALSHVADVRRGADPGGRRAAHAGAGDRRSLVLPRPARRGEGAGGPLRGRSGSSSRASASSSARASGGRPPSMRRSINPCPRTRSHEKPRVRCRHRAWRRSRLRLCVHATLAPIDDELERPFPSLPPAELDELRSGYGSEQMTEVPGRAGHRLAAPGAISAATWAPR